MEDCDANDPNDATGTTDPAAMKATGTAPVPSAVPRGASVDDVVKQSHGVIELLSHCVGER
jgi:hypothetical protein